jgi:hypothetical protein
VKHYKSAAPFLLKSVRQLIPHVDTMSSGKMIDKNKYNDPHEKQMLPGKQLLGYKRRRE